MCNSFYIGCPLLAVPQNGYLNSTTAILGAVVSVSCNDGYTLQGSAVLTCQNDGSWDTSVPICSKGNDPGPFVQSIVSLTS